MAKTTVRADVTRFGVNNFSVHLTYKCSDGKFRDFTECEPEVQIQACYILRKARTPIEGASYYNYASKKYVESFDFMYDYEVGAVGISSTDEATMVNFIDTMISGCKNLDTQNDFILSYGPNCKTFHARESRFVFSGDYLRDWGAI